MQKSKFITIFCGIDERLVEDTLIKKLLSKHKFKPTKANPRMFYKQTIPLNLAHIQKDLSFFWYEFGKRKALKCTSFDSYYNCKANNLDWEELCLERNQ